MTSNRSGPEDCVDSVSPSLSSKAFCHVSNSMAVIRNNFIYRYYQYISGCVWVKLSWVAGLVGGVCHGDHVVGLISPHHTLHDLYVYHVVPTPINLPPGSSNQWVNTPPAHSTTSISDNNIGWTIVHHGGNQCTAICPNNQHLPHMPVNELFESGATPTARQKGSMDGRAERVEGYDGGRTGR